MIICIDPSTKSAGWAAFDEQSKRLVDSGHARSSKGDPIEIALAVRRDVARLLFIPDQISTLVIERPRHSKRKPVPVGDLITLGIAAGAIMGALAVHIVQVQEYEPGTWKGNTPKPAKGKPLSTYVIERRARGMLGEYELGHVHAPDGTGRDDVWDAIGLGLFFTGRATRGLCHRRTK